MKILRTSWNRLWRNKLLRLQLGSNLKAMGIAQKQKRYTPEEYYALERDAAYKSEYYDGEIFAMAGGTGPHSRIIANIVGELHYRLKGSPCAVYESSLRVMVRPTGLRTYPDASVFC